jgi:Zn finger protein HypA/HybF involved in hydrogenase expression
MHELPIAQGILERVLKAAADANAARVTRIHIIIGIFPVFPPSASSSTGTR